MNIIERTQYSADGGKTWAVDEDSARAYAVHPRLAEHVGTQRAGYILDAIRQHPNALIQAMRDMGALPTVNEDWAAYLNSDIGAAFKRGSEQAIEHAVTSEDGIEYNGQRYAVVPMEQHDKEKSALATMRKWALNHPDDWVNHYARCWCGARNITLEDN